MRAILLSVMCLIPAVLRAVPCDTLRLLTLPDNTISSATSIEAGPLTIPGERAPLMVPAFCRVLAVSRPTPDSSQSCVGETEGPRLLTGRQRDGLPQRFEQTPLVRLARSCDVESRAVID